mmetsp:Transcript_9275/g.13875  ORF Transcript_9275/g.13875 Transcript_9275/m.13875 type:complete len:234 (-) Transcript_9275:158-859(-)|eukprot:CAMPEP_0194110370 /NCGR_PEP_ID=MMETSP0150-20130528/9646_1 /TAXON_ID=122233 /ORGANISM="Chaetoceros debilis, Strain MM31A-1" /LENGTH=233 /DNA_ID=CAMNT_0038799541 /DNA_START=144 /DNA_END=845 /DNA_ORIENTATION=+
MIPAKNIKGFIPIATTLCTISTHLQSPAVYPVLGYLARSLARDYSHCTHTFPHPRTFSSITPRVANHGTATTTHDYHHPMASLLHEVDDFFPATKMPFFSSPFFEKTHFMPLLKQMDWIDNMRKKNYFPHYDLQTDNDKVSLTVDLPGVKKDDVNIEVKDEKVLHISGQRKTEADDGTVTDIKFDKQFSFGDSVDTSNIVADLANGVLKVVLPKIPTAPENIRKIDIGDTGGT